MATLRLFKALYLTPEEERGFGDLRSFQIDPELIKKTELIYTRTDNGYLYDCPVYQITMPIKLSTCWSSGARPFLNGPKKIVLLAGSYIYPFPEGHQVYGLDDWTRFEVTPIKE